MRARLSWNYFGWLKNEPDVPQYSCSWLNQTSWVILDKNFHINTLCQRLSYSIFALRQTKGASTVKAIRAAYHALVESHIRYGIILGGDSSKKNLMHWKWTLRVLRTSSRKKVAEASSMPSAFWNGYPLRFVKSLPSHLAEQCREMQTYIDKIQGITFISSCLS